MPRSKKRTTGEQPEMTMTVEELLDSGLVGIWKDRVDIKDNLEFARKLREIAWKGRTPRRVSSR